MRSIFYLRRTIALTKTLAVSPEHALEFLHDPPSMIMRSLVAFSFKEITSSQSGLDSSLESKYAITDFVPMFFGLFNTKTTVTATFKHNPDGTCMRVEALVGTQLKTTWNVKEVSVGVHKEGQLEGTLLTEVIEVTGFFLLMPLIMSTMKQSQQQSMQTLVTRICERYQCS